MNIAQFVARAARAFPDRIAITHGTATYLTYRELAGRTARLAQHLRHALGLDAGDRVALFMPNRPEYLEVITAIWWGGLAAVPINSKLHPRELAYILENSGARLVFSAGEHMEAAVACVGEARAVDVAGARYRALLEGSAEIAIHWNVPDDIAWLFYTSGTTGLPKGVMISHRNLLAASLCYFTDVDVIGANDCIVHAAPMSHGSGLYSLPHFCAAVPQVVPESGGFDPDEILTLSRRWPGMAMFAAPTMVKRLVDRVRAAAPPLDGIKTIVYGGGPMYLTDLREAIDFVGHRFAQIYGQGESPMCITALSKFHLADVAHPRHDTRLQSVGVAQSAVEVRVVDDEDHTLPHGEAGEVVVRGEPVMRGYWQNPVATAAALRHGWLHTGDVGSMDADGFLTLLDRSKDLIISGGSNIYPREVEEALLRHEGVAEVSVVGRRHPEWGEQVVAFVVARPGRTVTQETLDQICLDHIARFKRPRAYRFVEALPKNNYGKVLKTELRDRLAAEPGAGR